MNREKGIVSLIAIPALLTLGVTVLRLVGELNEWNPTLFSREAGGGGALVGIVWLVPIFGVYFGLRLARSGRGPSGRGRAIGYALLGVAVAFAGSAAAQLLPGGFFVVLPVINLMGVVGALVAARGWPGLARVLFGYGIAARIPVALVMLIAILAGWGTHYELGPPGTPEMGPLATWFWIGLVPQMVLWVAFTVMVGTLFGALSLLAVRGGSPQPVEAEAVSEEKVAAA